MRRNVACNKVLICKKKQLNKTCWKSLSLKKIRRELENKISKIQPFLKAIVLVKWIEGETEKLSVSRRNIVIVVIIVVCSESSKMRAQVKVTPWHAYAGTERKRRYSSNHSQSDTRKSVGGQHHTSGVLTREIPGTHCNGGWVGLLASLNVTENFASAGTRYPDRSAHRESLYRLH